MSSGDFLNSGSFRAILFIACLGLISGQAVAHSGIPSRYDRDIKQATKRYLPGVPWRLLKAQLWSESRLDPRAVSPAGARGIAQFMGPTFKEVSQRLGYDKSISPHMAEPAIIGAAYYMATLRLRFKMISDFEKHKYACASYNAGIGNVRKAWRLSDWSSIWDEVESQLPRVTGRHAKETRVYIKRIWQTWKRLEV